MYNSFLKVVNKYFHICKKSGKIISVKVKNKNVLFLPVIGILAIAWFLIRTVPKPSRAAYPCQRIAAGIGITFLSGIFGSFSLFKLLNKLTRNKSFIAVLCCLLLCAGAGIVTATLVNTFVSEELVVYADWNPGDSPNSPIGTAKGIHPGRVTWSHNPDATADTPSGSWYQSGNTNQEVVNSMFSASINALAGESSNSAAWDAVFRYFNQDHGKGSTGYTTGETIAIKINTVNTSSQSKWGSAIDACGETVLGLVDQLINQAGVPQQNIIIYDGGVGTIGDYVFNCVNQAYSGVRFEATTGWGSIATIGWVDNGITFSGTTMGTADSMRVAKCLWDADYLINLALLKKHESETAVTLCGKNHFGSIKDCRSIHDTIHDHENGMGSYNSLVDLLGHSEIGGKTLLFIIDGLWGAPQISGNPSRWSTAPFNNDWPSSLFMSQDGVAIDSVALDFINAEWTLWDNADNYLHEAARADNPPSGTFYDPENDGSSLQSLGVHEHWNNAQSKQYSRNLNSGNGIELVSVSSGTVPTPTPDYATPTPDYATPTPDYMTPTPDYMTPTPDYPTLTPTIPTILNAGDVNNDGICDIIDALKVAQYYVGLNPDNFDPGKADTDCDYDIDIVDALLIAQYYVGLISSLGC